MTDEKNDALEKAIADLKQRGASTEPPQDVVNATLAQLARAQQQAGSPSAGHNESKSRTLLLWSVGRLAAAAVVLLAAGYAFGRISTPQPHLDELRDALMPSLRASLEPALRDSISQETREEYQQAMVAGYVRLRDELTAQFRADLDRQAVQTFTASNTVTNELLAQLVEAVAAGRQQDRQLIAAALDEVQAQQAQNTAQLTDALVRLASETSSELERTQNVIRYLANTQSDTSIPYQDSSESMD